MLFFTRIYRFMLLTINNYVNCGVLVKSAFTPLSSQIMSTSFDYPVTQYICKILLFVRLKCKHFLKCSD